MNRTVLLASIAAGAVVGVLAAAVSSPTVNRALQSDTNIVVKTDRVTELIPLNAGLKLKRSGLFEMYFLTDEKVGFNSSGSYHFSRHGLSLMPENSKQVVPSEHDANVVDLMFSQRGMHSLEDIEIIPYSADAMILVAPRYSYFFTNTEQ